MPEVAEESTNVPLPPLVIQPEDKKADIRSKVWDYLDEHDLASYPKLPRRRISNFKGAEQAGDRIAELDLFKNAKILRIDPDKPLQEVRFKTLEAEKTLLVPTPKLRNHVFSKIVPPAECNPKLLRSCAARQGVREYSVPVDIDEKIPVDLVIVGCVAVSTKGWRIGKGGGLSDLEYSMMASMGVLDEKVPVVTMVHDCQVVDLPDDLFGPHDLPVDFIVTPTRVIQCDGNLRKPSGIIWSLLTPEKLNHIPVLKRLRYRQAQLGKDVKLEGETEAPTDLTDVVDEREDNGVEERRNNFRGRRPPPRRRKDGDDEGKLTGDEDRKDRGDERRTGERRGYRKNRFRSYRNRRFSNRKENENENDEKHYDGEERNGGESDNNADGEHRRRRTRNSSSEKHGDKNHDDDDDGREGEGRRRPVQRRRQFRSFMDTIEGSVYVGSLPRSLRVSQFKTEVRERKVNPLRVLWRGSSGFAFLNFKTQQDAEEALAALEGLQISDRALKLEMARSPTGRARRPRGTRSGGDSHAEDGDDRDD